MRVATALLGLIALALMGGCAPSEPEGDYKPPAEGTYKQADQVPGREGRTKAEAGGSESAGARTESR
ncbi:MAG: hypothetical protein JSS71_12630 [Armatimonadetes bacterium]|nr:hypothetical protein [Armatimonadota bacterium]MBX3109130.1 hypothetical protein [Fimbriimonadaceae bacterium]